MLNTAKQFQESPQVQGYMGNTNWAHWEKEKKKKKTSNLNVKEWGSVQDS